MVFTRSETKESERRAMRAYQRRWPSHKVTHWDDLDCHTMLKHGLIDDLTKARYERFKKIPEFGLDAIAVDPEGVAHGIQAKLRSSTILNCENLGTCLMMTLRMREHDARSITHVYCNRPIGADAAVYMPPFIKIHRLEEDPTDMDTSVDGGRPPLWSHQEEALEVLRQDDWTTGTLVMPCGTGKTRTFLEIIRGRTVIVSPRRTLADQTLRLVDGRKMLVDSDHGGSTEKDDVQAFWNAHEQCVVSTTLKSWENIVQALDPAPDLVIFDEGHHVTTKLFDMSRAEKTLLVSATPNVYEEDAKDDGYATAPTLFHMTIADALVAKRIADYRLYLPILQRGDPRDPHAKAAFLLDGIYRVGKSRRVVVFGSSWEDVDAVLEAAGDMHAKDAEVASAAGGKVVPLWRGEYKGTTNRNQRRRLEDEFQTFDGIALLGSVDVLREGVDLPLCDGVFIMDVTTNARRLVQAMMRAMRFQEDKIASIYLWAPDRDDVPTALRMLREEDPAFASKIRGHDSRVLTKNGEQHIAGESLWLDDVVRAINVRAVAASEKVLAKTRLVCEEFSTRGWKYGKDEVFPDALGGGSKWSFVHRRRTDGRRMKINAVVRAMFLEADPAFFEHKVVRTPEAIAWDGMSQDAKVDVVVEYYRTYGKTPPLSTPPGQWLKGIRQNKTRITDDNRTRLEAAGVRTTPLVKSKTSEHIEWVNKTEDQRVDWLIEYRREHGKDTPRSVKPMGEYLDSIRQGNVKITDANRARMVTVGIRTAPLVKPKAPEQIEWTTKTMDEKVDAHIAYFKLHKKLPPRSIGPMWRWLDNLRQRPHTVPPAIRDRLEEAGIRTTPKVKTPEQIEWAAKTEHEKVDGLIEYLGVHGRTPPMTVPMARWLDSIRQEKTPISDENRARLEAANIRTTSNGKRKRDDV